MTIYNKEVGFALTVGASIEISKLCPDNDITRIDVVLGSDYVKNLETTVEMILIMNRAYVAVEKMEGREADEITREEILTLTPKKINEVTKAMMDAFRSDSKGEVEVESKNGEKGAHERSLGFYSAGCTYSI